MAQVDTRQVRVFVPVELHAEVRVFAAAEGVSIAEALVRLARGGLSSRGRVAAAAPPTPVELPVAVESPRVDALEQARAQLLRAQPRPSNEGRDFSRAAQAGRKGGKR